MPALYPTMPPPHSRIPRSLSDHPGPPSSGPDSAPSSQIPPGPGILSHLRLFTEGETEAQKQKVIWPKSHSHSETEPEITPKSLTPSIGLLQHSTLSTSSFLHSFSKHTRALTIHETHSYNREQYGLLPVLTELTI